MCIYSLGVQNLPRKGKKKEAREEKTIVCVLKKEGNNKSEYLILQRPEKGNL